MRVLVADPYYALEEVAEIVADLAEVELADAPWEGDDVVALMVSPDQLVGVAELDRLPALRIVATCSVGYDNIDTAAAAETANSGCKQPPYSEE